MAFGDFTVVRAGTKWVLNSSGVLSEVANNFPAFEFNTDGTYRGLLVEPAGTNLALHSRDLTQASWTPTNATASRTATGADGTANTGTIVTATAGNATILQAITSASSARVFGARVRRRTGTGTVEITQDNGSTWTAITLTSTYQLFSTASQTLTNPTVGFRIATSGDAIDVDFCQAETGAVSTSPIVTAGSTANRVADSVTLTGASSLIGQSEGTIFVEHQPILSTGTPSQRLDSLRCPIPDPAFKCSTPSLDLMTRFLASTRTALLADLASAGFHFTNEDGPHASLNLLSSPQTGKMPVSTSAKSPHSLTKKGTSSYLPRPSIAPTSPPVKGLPSTRRLKHRLRHTISSHERMVKHSVCDSRTPTMGDTVHFYVYDCPWYHLRPRTR
jgi:hypothetical protein